MIERQRTPWASITRLSQRRRFTQARWTRVEFLYSIIAAELELSTTRSQLLNGAWETTTAFYGPAKPMRASGSCAPAIGFANGFSATVSVFTFGITISTGSIAGLSRRRGTRGWRKVRGSHCFCARMLRPGINDIWIAPRWHLPVFLWIQLQAGLLSVMQTGISGLKNTSFRRRHIF